jgi:VanZ family protein
MFHKLSAVLNQTAARLPARSAAYFWLFCGWAIRLWVLSSGKPSLNQANEIPHIDKVLHFIYFSVGGALLAASGGLKWQRLSRRWLFVLVALACSLIGRLDEYHQGFVPGRIGNDTGDWLADTMGGLFGGAAIIWYLLPRITSAAGRDR